MLIARSLVFRLLSFLTLVCCFLAAPSAAADVPLVEPVRVKEVTATPSPPIPFEVVPGEADGLAVIPADSRVPPVVPPSFVDVDDPVAGLNRSQRELITFDLRTQLERRQWVDAASEPGIRITQGGEGDPSVLGGRGGPQKDFGGVEFVFDPTADHYPIHVKIISNYMNANGQSVGASCSGTLIDPKHVLTAAHCIYMHEDSDGVAVNSFPTSSTVFPGYYAGAAGPWGPVTAVGFLTWTGWTDGEDFDDDVAVIELDRPVGASVGWHPYGTHSDCDYFEGGSWTRVGYPGEVFSGDFQYEQSGTFDDCDTNAFGWYGNNLQSDQLVYKGQSGSGAERDGVAWSVASHRTTPGSSHDCRIWPEAFDDIVGWIDDNTPTSFDFHALDVEVDDDSGLSGSPINGLSFLVHNYSREEGNAFISYTVYISTDNQITASDTYVTSGSFSNDFSRNESVRVNVPAPFVPPQLTNGDYFLGAVLTINDAIISNNDTGINDVEPFLVECATQGIPLPVNPQDDHPCVPTSVVLDWGSVPGIGVDYQVNIYPIPGLGTILDAPDPQLLVTGLVPGALYGWQVRATTDCGANSDWSQEFRFTTSGLLAPAVPRDPPDGSFCVPANVTLEWDGVPNASLYRIRFGASGSPATEYYTSSTSLALTGLLADERYVWNVTPADACGIYAASGAFVDFRTVTAAPANVLGLLRPIQDEATPPITELRTVTNRWAEVYEWELETLAGMPVDSDSELGPYDWVVGPLVGGDYRWRARYRQCSPGGGVWSPWSGWETFVVDDMAPQFASSPTSTSHDVSEWSTLPLVSVAWASATDNDAVATYWWVFDQSPTTVPDETYSGLGNSVEGELVSGQDHWFHLVAVDRAGNISDVEHVGPFWIDIDGPTIADITGDPGRDWSNADVAHASWDAAVDLHSGVAGYSVLWTTNKFDDPDTIIDQTGVTASLDPVPEGRMYFIVVAIDVLGNVGARKLLVFDIDRTPPAVTVLYPNGGEVLTTGFDYEFDFSVTDVTLFRDLILSYDYTTNGGQTWYPAVETASPSNVWIIPWAPPGAEVLFRVTAIDEARNVGEDVSDAPFFIDSPTATPELAQVLKVQLGSNVPNPFNPRTSIRFALPRQAYVRLDIYDVAGRVVRRLIDESLSGPAWHEVTWDGVDDSRRSVSSGVYITRLEADGEIATGRITLVK